jgi:hypothetical protein
MVIIASTLVDVLIAVPLAFLLGLLVGLFTASKYVIIRQRPEYRDYHDRGDRSSD